MKTLIGVWNSAHIAKTETIREFTKLLIGKYPLAEIRWLNDSPKGADLIPAGDFQCIVETASVRIGINSSTASKNPTNMLDQFFEKEDCGVALCATLAGAASEAVEGFALEHDYRLLWTSPYQVTSKTAGQRLFAEMNKLKARHLLDALETMGF